MNSTVKFPDNVEAKYRKRREGISLGLYELSILDLTVYIDRFILSGDETEEDLEEGKVLGDASFRASAMGDSPSIDVDEIEDEIDFDSIASNVEDADPRLSTWQEKVVEDHKNRLNNENEIAKIRRHLSRKIKKHILKDRKHDKAIANVTIVFPLPSKDPLITHRKFHDVAEAMQLNSSDMLRFVK